MALQLSGDALGLGKVLQVVRVSDGTTVSTTSTSFVDVPSVSVSITPSSASSKIILIGTAQVSPQGGATNRMRVQLTNSSNTVISGAESISGESSSAASFHHVTMFGYDEPSTTSVVTYKMRYRCNDAGMTAYVEGSIAATQLYAIEVAA